MNLKKQLERRHSNVALGRIDIKGNWIPPGPSSYEVKKEVKRVFKTKALRKGRPEG